MTSQASRSIEILQELVAIPSVNPAYDPDSRGEAQIANYIERWADDLGLEVRRQPVLPGRNNVIARLQRHQDAPTLLFEAHMDTVGVTPGTAGSFEPNIRDGRMYGRGTCDTKGSMAAMMVAIEQLAALRDQLDCNVEFLAAVGEETGGAGAIAYASERPRIDAAIVGEPTELRIVNGHKGVIRGSIVVTGRGAHTSVAEEGINAIDGMADVIVALRAVSAALPGGLTQGSFTVSLIEGGTGINIVPATCTIQYDRRIVPGESAELVASEIERALDRVRATRADVRVERPEPAHVVPPLDTPADAAIVLAASAAAATIEQNPAPTLVPYGSDACRLSSIGGIPSIVYGPGSIANAHSIDEYVSLDELDIATRFYEEAALAFGRRERRA
jgi:acetylornithine deacetylase